MASSGNISADTKRVSKRELLKKLAFAGPQRAKMSHNLENTQEQKVTLSVFSPVWLLGSVYCSLKPEMMQFPLGFLASSAAAAVAAVSHTHTPSFIIINFLQQQKH